MFGWDADCSQEGSICAENGGDTAQTPDRLQLKNKTTHFHQYLHISRGTGDGVLCHAKILSISAHT